MVTDARKLLVRVAATPKLCAKIEYTSANLRTMW